MLNFYLKYKKGKTEFWLYHIFDILKIPDQ